MVFRIDYWKMDSIKRVVFQRFGTILDYQCPEMKKSTPSPFTANSVLHPIQYYMNAIQYLVDKLINEPFDKRPKQKRSRSKIEFILQRFHQHFEHVKVTGVYHKQHDKMVWIADLKPECIWGESFVYKINTIQRFRKDYEIPLSQFQFFEYVVIPETWEHYNAFTSELLFRTIPLEYPYT